MNFVHASIPHRLAVFETDFGVALAFVQCVCILIAIIIVLSKRAKYYTSLVILIP